MLLECRINIIKLLSFLIIVLFISSCSKSRLESDIRDDDKVYICTGRYSKAYHTESDCKGLRNCTGEVKETTKISAKSSGRHFCNYCRNN